MPYFQLPHRFDDWSALLALPWCRAGLDVHRTASRWAEFDWARFPIAQLQPGQLLAWEQSLLDLDGPDRLLRFGHAASDEQIRRYVAGIDLDRDVVLGVYGRATTLVAGAHVALMQAEGGAQEAEFGVHVAPSARGTGLGRRLFERAQIVARNRGASALQVHAWVGNAPMQRIVQRSEATTTRDGADTVSRLELAKPNAVTLLDEALARHAAEWRGVLEAGLAALPEPIAGPAGAPLFGSRSSATT
jgi:GNAT superfamily N-acetyltransferase